MKILTEKCAMRMGRETAYKLMELRIKILALLLETAPKRDQVIKSATIVRIDEKIPRQRTNPAQNSTVPYSLFSNAVRDVSVGLDGLNSVAT